MEKTNTTDTPVETPVNYRTLDPKTMPPVVWNVPSTPEQYLRNKMARTRNWSVISSKMDYPNKKFLYKIVKGPEVVPAEITFEEACKDFGWKSFTLTENMQTIIPDPHKIEY